MDEPDWIARVRANSTGISRDLSYGNKFAAQRLVDLFALIEHAPTAALQAMESIPEVDLAAASIAAEQRILRGHSAVKLANGASVREILIDLWAQMRALDRMLSQDRYMFRTSQPMKDWIHSSDGVTLYLVPTVVPRRFPTGSLQSFRHRALLFHRVLPTKINDFELVLAQAPGKLSANGMRALGAAFFLNFDLVEEQVGSALAVTSISAPGHTEAINEAVERAHLAERNILLFPELTVDLQSKANIQALLRNKPWHEKSKWITSIVVAGSWHEKIDGSVFNVATILDGYGTMLALHKKLFPYLDRKKSAHEAIEPGDKITAVVLDDAIVVFAICRDFCERITPFVNPFAILDVDLALVISLGNKKTLEGHEQTARDLKMHFGAEAFVVQQAYPNDGKALGFVICPSNGSSGFEWNSAWYQNP